MIADVLIRTTAASSTKAMRFEVVATDNPVDGTTKHFGRLRWQVADWLLGHETEINETFVLGTGHRSL